jgi:hypothetical protein
VGVVGFWQAEDVEDERRWMMIDPWPDLGRVRPAYGVHSRHSSGSQGHPIRAGDFFQTDSQTDVQRDNNSSSSSSRQALEVKSNRSRQKRGSLADVVQYEWKRHTGVRFISQ